jgi:hypothetical protein
LASKAVAKKRQLRIRGARVAHRAAVASAFEGVVMAVSSLMRNVLAA